MITYSVCRANRNSCTAVDGMLNLADALHCYEDSKDSNKYYWVALFGFSSIGKISIVKEWRESDSNPGNTGSKDWSAIGVPPGSSGPDGSMDTAEKFWRAYCGDVFEPDGFDR